MGTSLALSPPIAAHRYQVLRRLGVSANSEVLLAIDRGPYGFERAVVLKRLLPGVVGVARIAREAMAYARLAHPAIVRLYDFVEDRGRPTLVLEHVDGPSLARVIGVLRSRGARIDDDAALLVGHRLFGALAAAHEARDPLTRELTPIVHRDVGPANVIVSKEGYVKLLDFGVARLGPSTETNPGDVVGTLGYLAPEQVRAEPVTVRTDVYAAALVVRELLTGAPAFEAASDVKLLAAMAEPDLAPLRELRPDLPSRVLDVLEDALAPDPDQRGVTAEEVAAILRSTIDVEVARRHLVARIATLGLEDDRAAAPARRQLDETQTAPGLGDPHAAITTRPPPPESLVVRRAHSSEATVVTEVHLPPLPPLPFALLEPPVAPPLPPQPRTALFGSLAAIAVLVGAFSGGAFAWRDHARRGRVPPKVTLELVPPPQPHPQPPPQPQPQPPPQPPPQPLRQPPPSPPDLPPLKGLLLTDAREEGHRIFLDGRLLGGGGSPLIAPCGTHEVRVGSRGRLRTVTIPCGGELLVGR